jgi:4-amino-4-deoxy-L-arabinose transferase-like glycosyltransferase
MLQSSAVKKTIWQKSSLPPWRSELFACLRSWEFYLILLVAAGLRFYLINTTEFDTDQTNIFRMAYDAAHNGMLVATANASSLNMLNPPATIYFLMVPATFSSDPLWGAVWIAILAWLAVLLCYVFTRRYYGRLAASIAASFYAVAGVAIGYSRFMWNQNFLLFFVMLFIVILYLGAVERRKGWLIWALPLLGLLYQFHGSAVYLIPALGVALLLSPGTVRWRDPLLGVLLLLLIYAPYLLWELHVRFFDVKVLLEASRKPAQIDDTIWGLYREFLSPYERRASLIVPRLQVEVAPLLQGASYVMTFLVCLAAGLLLLQALFTRKEERVPERAKGILGAIKNWCLDLWADPARCGLWILLMWQIFPVMLLIRHAIVIYPHYLIFFFPGQFILIGILLALCVRWLSRPIVLAQVGRALVLLLAVLLIAAQLIGSSVDLFQFTKGASKDRDWGGGPYHNQLVSLQTAINRANQIAQERHLSRVIVVNDWSNGLAFRYLAEHISKPTTVVEENCLVLPSAESGRILMLFSPYSGNTENWTNRYAHTELLEEIPRSTGAPFRLLLVDTSSKQTTTAATQPTLGQDLRLLGTAALMRESQPITLTRWQILRNERTNFETTYTYTFTNQASVSKDHNQQRCVLSNLHQGDQLLAQFDTLLPLTVQATYSVTRPLTATLLPSLPLQFLTGGEDISAPALLRTNTGSDSLHVELAP